MRVLQLAPIGETVPPPAYGGIEVVVSLLTEELVRRGHEVTLFASRDTCTSAETRAFYPRSLRSVKESVTESDHLVWLQAAAALIEAQNSYDLVHNHAGELPLMFSSLLSAPMLATFHRPPSPYLDRFWPRYHGIEVDTFPFDPEKGPLEAIEIAQRLGKRLIMAGKVDRRDREFFDREVRPLIDGEHVCCFGEADGRPKRELFRKARCLLKSITYRFTHARSRLPSRSSFDSVISSLSCLKPIDRFRAAQGFMVLSAAPGHL